MLQHFSTFNGHVGRVWHCSWSFSGEHIATCGEDKTVRIWSVDETCHTMCVALLEEGQTTKTIRCCEWSPDGTMIATASFDGTVFIWLASNKSFRNWDQIACLEGHENEVKSVSWSSDGSFLSSCGRDKKIWIWEKLDVGDFECVAMLEGHTQDVKFLKWHQSERTLFSSSYDDTIRIWKEDNDEWYCFATLSGHSSTVWGLDINASGGEMVSCSDDRSLVLWHSNADSDRIWKVVAKAEGLHKLAIYSVAWNNFSGIIATGAGDNAISICHISAPQDGDGKFHLDENLQNAHDGDINCLRWNPAMGRKDILVSVSDDGCGKLWKYHTEK